MLPLLRNPLRRTPRFNLRFNSTTSSSTTTPSSSELTQKQRETLQYLRETPWRTIRLPLREGATEEEKTAYHREGKLRNLHFSLWNTKKVTPAPKWIVANEGPKQVEVSVWETVPTGKIVAKEKKETKQKPQRKKETDQKPPKTRFNNSFKGRLEKAEAQNKALTERLSAIESQLQSNLPSKKKTDTQLTKRTDLTKALADTMKQVQEGLSRTQDLLLQISQADAHPPKSPKPTPHNAKSTPYTSKPKFIRQTAKTPADPKPATKRPTFRTNHKTFSSIFAEAASKASLKPPRPYTYLVSIPPRTPKPDTNSPTIRTKDASGRDVEQEVQVRTGLLFDTVKVGGRVWDTVLSRRKKPRTFHTVPVKQGWRRVGNPGGGKG